MPQDWKDFQGAGRDCVQRRKNLPMTSNVSAPISIPIKNGGPFCLSLSSLQFPSNVNFTHTERNNMFIWFPQTGSGGRPFPRFRGCNEPSETTTFSFERNPKPSLPPPSILSMASLATNSERENSRKKYDRGGVHTHKHPTPSKCPQ